ncbi:hypothetical protein PssB301D_05213 [Pseudomonas syringae pv. syringae str. B301D-R]|nr:hypothetical protein PsyrB_19635 [Pseudomonas syringae pv. syringae B301D]EXL28622.1 hypothetical protein PssB301D_05213 [Pseudomonas syringae pv. syringae str. B301D-R]
MGVGLTVAVRPSASISLLLSTSKQTDCTILISNIQDFLIL